MVLSQWCLFMNPKVDFTIHTNVTTDDPKQVPVINGNISRDNPEPRHKIQMIQRTDELTSDPDDQLLPNVRDSVWIEPQMILVFQPVVLTITTTTSSYLLQQLHHTYHPSPPHEEKRVSVDGFLSACPKYPNCLPFVVVSAFIIIFSTQFITT